MVAAKGTIRIFIIDMNVHNTLLNSLFILMISTGMSISLNTMAQTNKFDAQGHRGCRGLMPENTIPAMLKAIDLGVTTIEMDVVITSDGKVLVSHDTYMNAEISTDPSGKYIQPGDQSKYNIFQMTAAEVQKWDVGLKPHPKFPAQEKLKAVKPLLSDLIDAVESYVKQKGGRPILYNIETKSNPSTDGKNHPDPERFTSLLMDVIREKKITKRVTIQSFDKRTLQVLHRTHPKVNLSFLIDARNRSMPEDLEKELGFKPATISPAFQLVDQQYVDACHRLGIKVLPWTVNDKAGIDRLKALGVDGIISDYPDLFN
jgi:glycerophosphoryl diester phosphodiesterase